MSISSNISSIVGTKYFDSSKLTVLIIHGWRENYQDEITSTLVDAFLTRPEYNIIFADWSRYADIGDYVAATGAISEVAKTYIKLLNQLKSAGYDLTKIYAVGHSLGAHLAGKIGELLQSRNILLSRITGLDPAGPLFTYPVTINILGIKVTLPGNNLLVKGNAKFVDIIHSNAGVAGTIISTGDLDFWPNGGKTQSHCVGCGQVDLLNAISCNECEHAASWLYYAESVRSQTPNFKAIKCPKNIFVYDNHTCTGSETAFMGFHASRSSQPGNYYLATRATVPYSF
ncbi:hypothetical protein ACKWTF_014364 [Chironomus riparius]